ncbi:MAG: TolC family protein [Verrucomicrobia bacterium]|nr:TolC family protein [Verrucomicrobiota bacterium]
MYRKQLIACYIGLIVGSALVAQETPTSVSPNSIDALVSMALANNAELKSFEAEVAVARGQRTQAGFFKNPEVSFEFGGREVRDSENILQGNGTTLSVSVMQTFEFPGKGTLRKAIANKNIEIAELGLEQFRLSLAGQVRVLAYEHLAAVAEAQAAEAVYKQSNELASQLNSQANFGARLQIEIRLVQASLIELGEAIKDASLRREETRTQLNSLLGRPQNLPLRISASLTPPTKRLDDTALVFAAQSNNPLLKIRQKELERSARELTSTRLDIAPDFSIGPFFSRDVAGDTEQNIGGAISASVPIWDWNIGNIQSAKARSAMAEALRVKAERDTEAQILSRLKAYELTRRQLGMIPSGLLQNIQEASTLADTQFRNGSIGAQLYLDTQSAYLNSLQISQKAVLDAWRTLLDLNLLTGGKLDSPRDAKP